MTQRVLRSRSRTETTDSPTTSTAQPGPSPYRLKSHVTQPPRVITEKLTTKTTGLSKKDLATLKLKRNKLLSPSSQTADFIADLPQSSAGEALAAAARATLVFAQHEAGTAVCVAASGLVLTCSHCVAESAEEHAAGNLHWLIFSSGQVVQAKCVAWDPKRDLALLQVIAAERSAHHNDEPSTAEPSFPFATIAAHAPPTPSKRLGIPLICIGHPGSEDLETDSSTSVLLNYDVLHISDGHYRGLAARQDPQDNSQIGALKHDCWTYWGHSGAPLIDAKSGEVIGLHSSWDDRTGMRRGIGWEAIQGFLGDRCEESSL